MRLGEKRLGRQFGVGLVATRALTVSGFGRRACGRSPFLSFGVAVGSSRPSASSLRPISSSRLGPVRQVRQAGQLLDLHRLKIEMLIDRRLQAVGAVEVLPFGLQHGDRLALALNLGLQLRDLLGVVERLVLDRIGVARRRDQRRDGDDVKQPDHRRPPRFSAVCGSSASIVMALEGSCAGASVRAPARSFAERARGLRRDLLVARDDRAAGDRSKVGSGQRSRRQMARSAGGASGARGEELLHDPVLERMEGDDHEPSARASGSARPRAAPGRARRVRR